jgi:hypothetical protein
MTYSLSEATLMSKVKGKLYHLHPGHQVNVMFTPTEYAQFEKFFQHRLKNIEPGMRLTRSGYARMLIMGMLESEGIGSDEA